MPEQPQIEKVRVWNSKLARRLVPIAAALVALPVVLSVLVLGEIGRSQIVRTAHQMQAINGDALTDAGAEFQRLGRRTIDNSTRQSGEISAAAVHAFSERQQVWQAQYLKSTAGEFNALTRSSLAGSTRQSLATHRQILQEVSGRMGSIYAQSTRDAQQRAVIRFQTALTAQIEQVMQDRADALAEQVAQNIQSHRNYLALTAQMPEFLSDDAEGQKAILDALVRRYPMLTVVSAVDANGQETAMSASDHIVTSTDLGNRANTDYFKTTMLDEPFVGIAPPSDDDPAPTLRIATPIERYRGRVVGALTARMKLDDAWDILQSARIGDSGFAYVVDNHGAYLLRPRRPIGPDMLNKSAKVDDLGWRICVAEPQAEVQEPIEALQRQIDENGAVALSRMRESLEDTSRTAEVRMQQGENALQRSVENRVESRSHTVFEQFRKGAAQQTQAELAKVQSAISSQAEVAERQNDQAMDAETRSSLSIMQRRAKPLTFSALSDADSSLTEAGLWVMVASVVVGALVALLLAAAIVRPVILLAQGTRAIAAGDLDKRVDEHAPGEIEDLAVAFNKMAVSLLASRNDLRQAETQLVHSAKLASLGTLSAGVAHELNQPLAIIRGVAQQLQDEEVSDFMREDLVLIEGQTTRMMKIVKHLRTFSRAGAYEMSAIDVNQTITDCFILVGAQLKAHNIEVDFDLSTETPFVVGDANELEQVFLNLITNARDALDAREDAKLTIRTRIEDGQVVTEFADNGTGVPEEIAEHIFDPFFTTKEPGKGTGLGLSISHGIIDKHQGTITLRNEGGAVFKITLPRADEENGESTNVARAA